MLAQSPVFGQKKDLQTLSCTYHTYVCSNLNEDGLYVRTAVHAHGYVRTRYDRKHIRSYSCDKLNSMINVHVPGIKYKVPGIGTTWYTFSCHTPGVRRKGLSERHTYRTAVQLFFVFVFAVLAVPLSVRAVSYTHLTLPTILLV